MNRNQKIAVGCGAAGCLGLIVLAVIAGIFFYWQSRPRPYAIERNRNFNFNANSNSNSNATGESAPPSSASDTGSSYSDEEKHRLFQAASMSGDAELVTKVVKRTGLFNSDGTPAPGYEQFVKDHIIWGASNQAFIVSINTPEKARAYVDEHLKD
jgi:hypothetical protein